jgi:hypothetical protein
MDGGKLRPGELHAHPAVSPVRDWGTKSVTLPLAAGIVRKPNPLLAPIVK